MDKENKLEEEILASFERGEWQSVPNLNAELARFASMASASLIKDKRVNIRISSRDLEDIQAKAAEEAIPYQTLMSSVLHKFVTGRLVEAAPGPDIPFGQAAPKTQHPINLNFHHARKIRTPSRQYRSITQPRVLRDLANQNRPARLAPSSCASFPPDRTPGREPESIHLPRS